LVAGSSNPSCWIAVGTDAQRISSQKGSSHVGLMILRTQVAERASVLVPCLTTEREFHRNQRRACHLVFSSAACARKDHDTGLRTSGSSCQGQGHFDARHGSRPGMRGGVARVMMKGRYSSGFGFGMVEARREGPRILGCRIALIRVEGNARAGESCSQSCTRKNKDAKGVYKAVNWDIKGGSS
jgi:hypothetical protein